MKKSDIYDVALKITGIYFFVKFCLGLIERIGQIIFILIDLGKTTGSFGYVFMISFISFALEAFICYLLIFKTKTLVSWFHRSANDDEEIKLAFPVKVIYKAVIVAIGLSVIAWSLPVVLNDLYSSYIQQRTAPPDSNIAFESKIFLRDKKLFMQDTLEVVVGIALLLSADMLSNYFSKDEQASTETTGV